MEKIKVPIGQQELPNTPDPYKSFAPLYGAPNLKNGDKPLKFLEPAPRNQLGVPTNHKFNNEFPLTSYYQSPLDNGNFVRGNQFANVYPYQAEGKVMEVLKDEDKKENVIVAKSPFYPFPGQKNMSNKKYWTYPRELPYINNQPIFNYPYNEPEGVVENFENYKVSFRFANLTLLLLVLLILAFFIFRK